MKKTEKVEKSMNDQIVLRDTPKSIVVKTRVRAGVKISD